MPFGGAIGQQRDICRELIDSLGPHGRESGLGVSEIPFFSIERLTSPGWDPLLLARIILVSSVVAVRQLIPL
jgi:hypothetical protein